MIQIAQGTGPLTKNLEASDPLLMFLQDSQGSRGVVLRLEQLLEALQDRRRRTDQDLRRRPGEDGDQSDVRPQEVHLEVPEVFQPH